MGRIGRNEWLAALIVSLAACLAYATTMGSYFIQDDFGVVQLLSHKPAPAFLRWFVSAWTDHIYGYTADEVRPFPAVSYQLAALWGAASPVANHVFNIGFHAGNGVLVLALARAAAGLSVPASTLAALVFVLLPVQAESVAWITGRVDSMPAFFYLASFLAWVYWRAGGRMRAYAWSLVLFFVALFCKQNAITMVPALMGYDVIVSSQTIARRVLRTRRVWNWLLPYLPFVALTAGYLALRYALFGEIAREDQLNAQSGQFFAGLVGRHLQRLVFGTVIVTRRHWTVALALFALCGASLIRFARVKSRHVAPQVTPGHPGGAAFYFGIIWTVLGIAPIFVAGYESPRHMYLAAVGWAMAIGIAFDIVLHLQPERMWRWIAAAAGAVVLIAYSVQLGSVVRDWNKRAALSRVAVEDLEREAAAAREGTLLIAGAPRSSWEWALPFAAQDDRKH